MNVVLWVVQILLALAFALAGFMKVSQPIENLKKNMAYVNDFAPRTVRLIGVLELLGALGLILPAVTRILPWLVPVAAIGLVLTMVGACITHVRRKETAQLSVPVILLILALVIVLGRFLIIPIA